MAGLASWSNPILVIASACMKEVEKRKNETPPHIPSYGYSHVACLWLSMVEKCFCSCNAMATEKHQIVIKGDY